jgi:hypothetical protein
MRTYTRITGVVALACALLVDVVYGLSMRDRPFVVASANGQYAVKIVRLGRVPKGVTLEQFSDNPEKFPSLKPYIECYKIDEYGDLVSEWRCEGYFGSTGLIDDEGRYFILVESIIQDQPKTARVLTFFDRGKVIKEYTLGNLLGNEAKLESTGPIQFWYKGGEKLLEIVNGKVFFQMVDGRDVTFEVATGKMTVIGK